MHEALGSGAKLLALGGGCLVLCAACFVLAIVAIGACAAVTKGFTQRTK